MNNFQLSQCKEVLIIGAGHGIGFGLVNEILTKNKTLHLHATFRDKNLASPLLELKDHPRLSIYGLDPCNEEEVAALSNKLEGKTFDLIINCVGFLYNDKFRPEKSFRNFSLEYFLESMKVNASVSALLFKYFEQTLSKEKISSFINISAKVGSIEDNSLGGWYSYRSSKAALNMLIKCISIELKRKKTPCIVLAIHPGTTTTELSNPFSKNISHKIHSINETAHNILEVLEEKTIEDSGQFFNWDGQTIPW
ncbi:MAG: SDR family NAD(P)-dependent oxidoreductase [Bacteriovoracaceae bacterium]